MNRSIQLVAVFTLGSAGVLVVSGGSASAESADEPSNAPVVATEMIVWLEDGADPSDVAADNSVVLLETLVGHRNIHLFGSGDMIEDDKVDKVFDKDDRVRYVEPNYEGASADGNRAHAWPVHPRPLMSEDGAFGDGLESMQLDLVHEWSTGEGTVVAILDTGIDAGHELLAGHIVPGWDFVDDDADPHDEQTGLDADGDGMSDEVWGHGTHIAGIVVQVAPDAEIVSYRVLDSEGDGRVFAVAAAIFDATDRGVDVINLSFGLDHRSESKMLKDAMKYAKKGDVIVVAAAGNDGEGDKRYPAAEKDVMSVGALDPDADELASFASYGDWVEVAAPGVSVMSTLPNGRIGTWSGSSMAAPFVTAQASLLLAASPNLSSKKVMNAIRKSSRKPDHGNRVKHGMIDVLGSFGELD